MTEQQAKELALLSIEAAMMRRYAQYLESLGLHIPDINGHMPEFFESLKDDRPVHLHMIEQLMHEPRKLN